MDKNTEKKTPKKEPTDSEISMPGKKVISKNNAKRIAAKITQQISKEVLEPKGLYISKLPRKEKATFKKAFNRFCLNEIVKHTYIVKKS